MGNHNISNADAAKLRLETQRLVIKGYNGASILEVLNGERIAEGKRPIHKATVYSWLRGFDNQSSKAYLDLLKDKSAFIVLHRRKLLALELYRSMIHDKIAAMGGIQGVKGETLNRFIQTLLHITVTESRLEKEIPQLFNVTETMRPEQIKTLEDEIVSGLPKDLQDQFLKENNRRQRQLEAALQQANGGALSTEELIDLDSYPKDTHVI